MVSILIADCLFIFDIQQNIFTLSRQIVQLFSNKYPFSYFPAWELRLPSLQTPTFKPANYTPSNFLIPNDLSKSRSIPNNLYISAFSQHIAATLPPYFTLVLMPSTTRSNTCFLSYQSSFSIVKPYQND